MNDATSSTFSALADPTRRAILARLAMGETSVTELAAPFEMSLPAISRHLKVLEKAGLVSRGREAQWRPCRLNAGPLKAASGWLEDYRRHWEVSFDRLDEYLDVLKKKERKRAGKAEALAEQYELTLTRTFDAPRALVWAAWTDPAHLQQWMGPRGFVASHAQYDLYAGGKWRACLHRIETGKGCGESAGEDLWQSGMFLEVKAPERLVFTFGWDGREDMPRNESVVTVTFEERRGVTHMNFHQAFFPSAADRDGHEGGWNSTFDRLAEFLREAARPRTDEVITRGL